MYYQLQQNDLAYLSCYPMKWTIFFFLNLKEVWLFKNHFNNQTNYRRIWILLAQYLFILISEYFLLEIFRRWMFLLI